MTQPNKPAMHFTADAHLAPLSTLKLYVGEGDAMTELRAGVEGAPTRAELLRQVRAGEFQGPLVVEATTFIQRATPNRNYARLARGTLRTGARSFVGQVVLLDHDQRSQQARIGTIIDSKAAKDDEGNVTFVMKLSIVKLHAIESVLDGTIDRFSIGWFPTGPVVCSVHEQPLWGADCCPCWPGQTVNGKTVEAVFTAWDGIEVSAVNVPAVVGTGIDQIRAALSALRANDNGEKPHTPAQKETTMNLRTYLGLADDATDEQITAALAARDAQEKERTSKLAQYEAQQQTTAQQLAAARQARIDQAVAAAKADGRLHIVRDSQGKEIASELESRVRAVASSDVDTAIALLDAMPKSHPNGNPTALQSQTPPAPAPVVKPTSTQLDNMLPLMGLDANDVAVYGPDNRRQSPKGAPVPRHLSKLFATRHINHNPNR